MSSHAAIATTAKGVIEEIQVPTAKPGAGEVLVKNEYAAMIAFDTYQTDSGYNVKASDYPLVLGFSAAGTIAAIGPDVHDLAVGDRVSAFTYQSSQAKSTQEYSLLSQTVVAKVPENVALDGAASLPDNFVTAFWTIFGTLKFPLPDSFPATVPPPLADTPILVYGAGASSAQYCIQVLKLAGYKHVIATASPRHHDYLRSIGATHTFDYSSVDLTAQILKASGGPVKVAIDPIASETSLVAIKEVVGPGSKFAILLPVKEGTTVTGPPGTKMTLQIPESYVTMFSGVELLGVATFTYQTDTYLKENLMSKILPQLLATGAIQPNRVRLLDQGTFKDRVELGLDLLRNNKISGEKVVVKVKA